MSAKLAELKAAAQQVTASLAKVIARLEQLEAEPALSLPVFQKPEWLAKALGVKNKAVYDIIAAKQIPAECVFRVGARIRIREKQALEWLHGLGITPPEGQSVS